MPGIIHAVVTLCLIAKPDVCTDRDVQIVGEPGNPQQCSMRVMAELPRLGYAQQNPQRWFAQKWRCGHRQTGSL